MKITLKRIIDGQQGYWSIVELEHIEEEFMTHPQAQASWMGNHVRGIYPNSLKRALTVGALIFLFIRAINADYLKIKQ